MCASGCRLGKLITVPGLKETWKDGDTGDIPCSGRALERWREHSGQRASEEMFIRLSAWYVQGTTDALTLLVPGEEKGLRKRGCPLGIFPLMRVVRRCFICGFKFRGKSRAKTMGVLSL